MQSDKTIMKALKHNRLTFFLKNNKNYSSTLLICIVVFFSSVAFSQEIEKSSYQNPDHSAGNYMPIKQGWFIGADVGTTFFYGDVSLYNNFPKFKDLSKSTGTGLCVFGGKKFLFGLAAEIQLFKGTLKGEKISGNLYPRYFNADLMGYSVNAKYNLSQLLFRDKNDRSFFNRMSLFLTVGGGQTFFRSRLYKLANNNQWYLERVSGFTSSGIDSAGIGSAGGLVTDKAKTVSAIILPIGGKINFKLNQKTDLVLDVSYVTVFSDQVDAWVRTWSHKDRYLYMGLGMMYNFGAKSEADIPDSDRILRNKVGFRSNKKSNNNFDDAYDSNAGSDTDNKGLFKGKSSGKKQSKADKDLEIKLKMYELQLKLFEMQYLVQ